MAPKSNPSLALMNYAVDKKTSYHSMDPLNEPELQSHQLDPHEDQVRPSIIRKKSFIAEFTKSSGPPQVVALIILIAIGFGSTIGIIPAVMTDRFARIHNGYTGERDCSDYSVEDKPQACFDGSADAQNAAAVANFINNGLTFFSSSLVGSLSDQYGRKGLLIIGLLLSSFAPVCLVLVQILPELSPLWYYGANALSGAVSWMIISLSSLSDVMPQKWRAASFGVVFAAFSLGIAIAPLISTSLSHLQTSILAVAIVALAFISTIIFFPETLSPETAIQAEIMREEMEESTGRIQWYLLRPVWELSILNRNYLFRVLSVLAFFSGLVQSGEQTLILYYAEERLEFNDKDVAIMFLLIGICGILVQGVLLKPLNALIGEKNIIIVAFSFGSLNCLIYGLAKNKATMFVGFAISTLMGMSFPTVSAIKANNAEKSEQGRIQGALSSVQALASALGPLLLRAVYHKTKDTFPGAMFIVASGVFIIAAFLACALPTDQTDSRLKEENDEIEYLLSDTEDLSDDGDIHNTL